MGMNKQLVGRSYPAVQYTVTKEAIQKYALGINETSPLYFDEHREGGLLSPPLFGIVFSLPASAAPLFDPELNANIMKLVHGEQDMRIHSLARPGDELSTSAKILAIEDKGSGELITIESTSKDKSGRTVLESKAGYFVRGGLKGEPRSDGKAPTTSNSDNVESNRKISVVATMDIAKDQSLRYAEGSGDRNPIHVNDDVAKMAGLPGIIIHGMCTLGLAVKGFVDKQLDSDPRKLKRVLVRFSKIVLPKQTVTTEGWILEKTDKFVIYGFETRNNAGEVVLKNGILETDV